MRFKIRALGVTDANKLIESVTSTNKLWLIQDQRDIYDTNLILGHLHHGQESLVATREEARGPAVP